MISKSINTYISLFLLLMISICSCKTEQKSQSVASAEKLIERLMPEHKDSFIIQEITSEIGADIFEIEQGENDKIIIRGNNAVSIASGVNYYLKHVTNSHVSWNGNQLDLPSKLPKVVEKISKDTHYMYNFNFNYCTFNYSMPWWDWDRWEQEIDFMALNGVNMPLAIVGMEAVWFNFLKRYNYSDDEAKEFISGPGYTAWWLMGNLEGRGGPVTASWLKSRIALQKKILKRMRELGMRPALPGFVGIVPTSLDKHVPSAQLLDQGKWASGDVRPAVLNPETPLFGEMATAWYEELDKLYGSVDAFAGDLFHEGGKTHGLDVGNIAVQVQKHMMEYNPNSIWCIQGWGGNPKKKLLEGLKDENTLVVELCGEYFKNWRKTDGFNGKPWVFSTIIQYGGNVGLHGRLEDIAANLIDAQSIENKPVGIGTTWESIEVNAVVNDFLSEMRWETEVPNVEEWCEEYAVRRYGFDTPNIRKGWNMILETAYGSYKNHRRPTESVFCAPPSLKVRKASPFAASIEVHYDQRAFRDAINLMLLDAEKGADQSTFKYDIVDFTRQFMANAAQIPYNLMVAAFKEKNVPAFEESAGHFLNMMNDQDRLLGTESSFLLGKWIDDARNSASTPEQLAQNESNARVLITTWTKEKSGLDNYAWREWNGLLSTYYKPRWELFINSLRDQLNGVSSERVNFYSFQNKWASQTWEDQSYIIKPEGNQIKIAKELIDKWSFIIDNPEKYIGPKVKKIDKFETSENAR